MRSAIMLALAGGLAAVLVPPRPAAAEEAVFTMHSISRDGIGPSIGTVTARDGPDGLVLQPALHGLPPGGHGFHFHVLADCRPGPDNGKSVAAGASGDHFDPAQTGRHRGPLGRGHAGDLPLLRVDPSGTATRPVTAAHLKVAQIRDRALVIHEDGDNFADTPKPLGGGGGRVACGTLSPAGSP
jgi:Cu-Zn family superoxide dismutase